MNQVDRCNLEDVKADSVRQAYLRGAYRKGHSYGELGLPMPSEAPEGTLLYDETMRGWQDSINQRYGDGTERKEDGDLSNGSDHDST